MPAAGGGYIKSSQLHVIQPDKAKTWALAHTSHISAEAHHRTAPAAQKKTPKLDRTHDTLSSYLNDFVVKVGQAMLIWCCDITRDHRLQVAEAELVLYKILPLALLLTSSTGHLSGGSAAWGSPRTRCKRAMNHGCAVSALQRPSVFSRIHAVA
jgi:hypothetical protein